MKAPTDSPFQQDPPVFLLKDLTTRALEAHEYPLAGELLEQQHYLGDCPKGRQLLQVIEYKGHWVALLDWGPSCWKLADRERHKNNHSVYFYINQTSSLNSPALKRFT